MTNTKFYSRIENVVKKLGIFGGCSMKVIHKMIAAFASAAAVSLTAFGVAAFAQDGVVNASVLNVRDYPSYDSSVIGTLPNNLVVNVIEQGDGWFTIDYNGAPAYVASEYVDIAVPKNITPKVLLDTPIYGKTNAEGVYIRNGAQFDCSIVDAVPKGTKYIIYGEENGFFIVNIDGVERFICTEYLSGITEEEYYYEPTGAQQVVDVAMQYIGTPYAYGGSSPSGFDCSGFTSYVYRQLGVSLNRTAAGQTGNGYEVSKSELLPGDLVMFGPYSGGGIGHVGIYVGDGNMVHSPRPGKTVCVESINSNYYASRYVTARRIF